MNYLNYGPILNIYPDSIGGNLSNAVQFLKNQGVKQAFTCLYILPSMFHSDLDRGFSIIDYDLENKFVKEEDLNSLKQLGMSLKLDFVLNHKSMQSKEFKDILQNGRQSNYIDFFIDWNKFWKDHGKINENGILIPCESCFKLMHFRKPELPVLQVACSDGSTIPFWNTFYQEIISDPLNPDKKIYRGQMDLNIQSNLVWKQYKEVLNKLITYGAEIIRLDAFAYASKIPGMKNFFNEPHTWEILEQLQKLMNKQEVLLLPEIHTSYDEGVYEKLTKKGYLTYDFFLPGLLIHAIETHHCETLIQWANEIIQKNIKVINMLGCHDGIPLLDLRGLLEDEEIQKIIDLIVKRGGHVKNLHGKTDIYYQVNATYYSALGEDDKKMLFARALHMFMPGRPQVWYLDLFIGKNDYEAIKKAGKNGHKEINRTNLTIEEIENKLMLPVVKEQLRLITFRNNCSAFAQDADIHITQESNMTIFKWRHNSCQATLRANFETYNYEIEEEVYVEY